MRRLVSALFVLLTAAAPVAAQSCTTTQNPNSIASCSVSGTAAANIVKTVRLSLSAATTTLAAPTIAVFDAGLQSVATTGPNVTVKSNSAWVVSIRALNATWGASAEGRTDKVAADLLWSSSATGSFAPLSGTDTPIASGSATTGVSGTLFLKVAYSWLNDVPGTYTLPVVLTITAP